jgi:hypothetical protein
MTLALGEVIPTKQQFRYSTYQGPTRRPKLAEPHSKSAEPHSKSAEPLIQSFSDKAFVYLTQAEWLYPSNYEQNGNSDYSTVFSTRTQKSTLKQIGQSGCVLVRIVYAVAVQLLIAPVGIIYHLGKTLEYRVKLIRENNNNNSGNGTRAEKHFQAAKKDFYISLILVSMATAAYLVPLTASPLGWQILSTATGAFGIGELVLISCYVDPLSEIGHLLETTQANQLKTELYLRIELGMKQELAHEQAERQPNLLATIANQRADNLLNIITQIQTKMPENCRLPYQAYPREKEFRDAFAYYRSEIKDPEKGKGLQEDFQKLYQACRDLEMVQTYEGPRKGRNPKGFRSGEDELKLAFSGGPENNFELNYTPIKELRVDAISLILFKKMVTSDWFYPSNCKLQKIEDQGSIFVSLNSTNFAIDREKIQTWSHVFKKPLRATARFIALNTIAFVGAPMGTVYHLGRVLLQTAKYFKGGVNKDDHLEKLKSHAWAMFSDFTTPLMHSIGFYTGDSYNVETWVKIGCYTNEQAPLYKAIALRNNFGFVSPNGDLLSYHERLDRVQKDSGDLFLIGKWVDAWKGVILALVDLKETASEYNEPFNYQEFLNALKGPKNDLVKKIENTIPEETMVNDLKRDQWIEHIYELYESANDLKSTLQDSDSILFSTPNNRFSRKYPPIPFPFTPEFLDRIFNNTDQVNTELVEDILWQQSCKIALKNNPTKEVFPEFHRLKELLLTKEPTAYEVLGFEKNEKPSEISINHKFRMLTLKFHPDKVDSKLAEDCKKLFYLIAEAKKFALSKL